MVFDYKSLIFYIPYGFLSGILVSKFVKLILRCCTKKYEHITQCTCQRFATCICIPTHVRLIRQCSSLYLTSNVKSFTNELIRELNIASIIFGIGIQLWCQNSDMSLTRMIMVGSLIGFIFEFLARQGSECSDYHGNSLRKLMFYSCLGGLNENDMSNEDFDFKFFEYRSPLVKCNNCGLNFIDKYYNQKFETKVVKCTDFNNEFY